MGKASVTQYRVSEKVLELGAVLGQGSEGVGSVYRVYWRGVRGISVHTHTRCEDSVHRERERERCSATEITHQNVASMSQSYFIFFCKLKLELY